MFGLRKRLLRRNGTGKEKGLKDSGGAETTDNVHDQEVGKKVSSRILFGRNKEAYSSSPYEPKLPPPAPTPATSADATERTTSVISGDTHPSEIVFEVAPRRKVATDGSHRTKHTVGTASVDTPSCMSILSRRLPRQPSKSSFHSRRSRSEWNKTVFRVDDTVSVESAPLPPPDKVDSSHWDRSVFRLPENDNENEIGSGHAIKPKARRRASTSGASKTPWNQNLFTVDCGDDDDDRSDDHVILIENNPNKSTRSLTENDDHDLVVPANGFPDNSVDEGSVVTASTCSELSMGDPTMIKLYDKNGCLRKDLLIAMENGKPTMKNKEEAKFVKPQFIIVKPRKRLLL
jgi:hypothetical protein